MVIGLVSTPQLFFIIWPNFAMNSVSLLHAMTLSLGQQFDQVCSTSFAAMSACLLVMGTTSNQTSDWICHGGGVKNKIFLLLFSICLFAHLMRACQIHTKFLPGFGFLFCIFSWWESTLFGVFLCDLALVAFSTCAFCLLQWVFPH